MASVLAMSTADRSVVKAASNAPPVPLHAFQKRIVESPARFLHACITRQGGKSFCMSLRRVLRGMKRRRNQVFLSGSEQQSRELMEITAKHVKAMQIATEWSEGEFYSPLDNVKFSKLEIRIPEAGMRIIGLPANPDTARGFGGDLLLDEFSVHKRSQAIWAAAFPIATRNRGEIDVAGTPKGKNNMFYKLMSNAKFEHHKINIYDAVAQGMDLGGDTIEDLRQALGDEQIWRQEYECEFVDEATAFLTWEQIVACEDPQLSKSPDWAYLEACKNDLYVGIDVGRYHDWTVIWIVERVGGRLVTRGVIEIQNSTFAKQEEVIWRVLALRCMRRACMDKTGLGMQMAERAATEFGEHRVEGVSFTQASKEELAGGLRIKVEDRSVVIPADDKIRNDLHSIEKQVTAAGNIRYVADHSKDGHADRFWAAALAVHAAGNPSGPAEMFSAGPLRFGKTRGIW